MFHDIHNDIEYPSSLGSRSSKFGIIPSGQVTTKAVSPVQKPFLEYVAPFFVNFPSLDSLNKEDKRWR